MRIKKLLSVVMIFILILTFSGCKNKSASSISLNTPDKINMYVDGKQKQITKSGDKYDQALFDRINALISIRMPQEFSTMEGAISENDIKEAKGYSVEFVYDKAQTVTINNGNKEKVQFLEIIFPLSEKWQNIAFIKTKDNFYSPVGLKENLDYLVKASMK